MSGDTPQPLAGVVVVELATGISGPYCGKLLADHGADVIKIEPPAGDPTRREGTRPGPRPGPESSPLFLHLNTNKRSVVADLATDVGRAVVRRLVAGAHVVVDSTLPGAPDRVDLDPVSLRAGRPDLVVTSVTPFGLDGPYAAHDASEITLYALGGPMLATGDPDREPQKLAGDLVQYHAGSVAALATLAALSMAEATGTGTHLDVANLGTQAASIDRRAVLALGYQYDGSNGFREGGGRIGPIPAGVYPTDDGHCQIVFAPNWMPRVADMLGDEDLIRRFAAPDWVDDDEIPELLNTATFLWTLQRSKQQAMLDAQALRLAITPLNSTTDVLADPHFRDRRFWHRWDHPVVGGYEAPGDPLGLEGAWQARRPPPLLGEHTEEVVADPPPAVRAPIPPVATERRLPLEGIRVLDLTVVWAGPLTTTLLGDLGAEVIRFDNPNLFPTATRGAVPRPRPGRERDLGQYWGRFPDGEAGDRPWNRVGPFVCDARGKRSATLDLRTPLGRETFLGLVERSDVLVENNSVQVLPSLGLDWDVLHARNRRLISLRMPSLGLHGPYANYIGFGAHMEALCGLSSLRGYRDLDPTSLDATYYMDPASGVTAAFAALCALRRRDATGTGELIEFAQAENLLNYVGEYLIDASLTGEAHECHGNRHPHRAPQGVYPCRGDDRWVALSVADDAGWTRLAVALGRPAWACDPELATEDGRRARHDDLDAELAAWTSQRTADEAATALRAAGVAAAPVLDEEGLFTDPHLAARRFFRPNGSADVPDVLFPGHQWRWDGPDLRWGPLNVMGADNDHVYRTVLGLGDDEMAALDAERHLAPGYLDADGNLL